MNGDAEDQANKAYTITAPGMHDVFIIPADKETWRKRQVARIIRMKQQNSPIPNKLAWIPQVINYIDDAQDNLAIALIAGKFLLRFVAPRFVPYLGWALLANDILNLSTGLLSLAMTGSFGKIGLREIVTSLAFGRAKRMKRVAQFMSKTNWVGTAIQAGQVLEQHTGYGLRLGGVMGCASDIVWGAVRFAEGKQVRIVGPPPGDPLTKAARFLVQTAQMGWLSNEVTKEDHMIISAAQAVAAARFTEEMGFVQMDNRATILEQTQYPVFEPWDEDSRAALYDNDINPSGPIRPFYRGKSNTPTFQQLIYSNGQEQWNYEYYQRYIHGYSDTGTLMKTIHDQAGTDILSTTVEEPNNLEDMHHNILNLVYAMTEFELYPPSIPDEYDLQNFLEYMSYVMEDEGSRFVTYDVLRNALYEYYGGYSKLNPWSKHPGQYYD